MKEVEVVHNVLSKKNVWSIFPQLATDRRNQKQFFVAVTDWPSFIAARRQHTFPLLELNNVAAEWKRLLAIKPNEHYQDNPI